jgi:hypothetical protein
VHEQARAAVKRLRPERATKVYEVGSLDINGSIRALFPDAEAYHGVDLVPGPAVDAVGDGETHVPPFAPDCVVCCEVLEHALEPEAIVRQMAKVLAPGGTLVVTCAGPGRIPHSAVDGGNLRRGEHYQAVGAEQLYVWMNRAGLTDVCVETGAGVVEANLDGTREDADLYAYASKPVAVAHVAPSRATLSIVVGTLGRPSLDATLASIAAQRMPGDETVVVSANPDVAARAASFGARFVAIDRPGKDWGDTERGVGMMAAIGDYVAFMDDDDVYADGARHAIATAIAENPGLPLMFRMRFTGSGVIVWDDRTLRIGNVGTPCLVAPNDKAKLGRWGSKQRERACGPQDRGGDYDFMASMQWPREDIVWVPQVIALVEGRG